MTDVARRGTAGRSDPEVAATPPLSEGAEGRGLLRPAVREPRRRSRRATLGLRVVVPVAVFGLWWLLTGTGAIPSTKFPTPAATWDTFVFLLHHDLLGNVAISLARAGVGLAVGASIGLVLGIVVGLFTLGEELIDSSMQAFRTIPFPAVIFLFIVWVGIDELSKVLLIALATLFPMYLNTSNGVRNVDRKVVEAARSFGLSGAPLVRQVVIPLAMPSILTGLRFATGVAIIALVFAETLNASTGIGYLVSQAASFQQVGVLVVCIIVYALMGILADLLVRILERTLMPWRRHLAVR